MTAHVTDAELAEVLALDAAATPGPWEIERPEIAFEDYEEYDGDPERATFPDRVGPWEVSGHAAEEAGGGLDDKQAYQRIEADADFTTRARVLLPTIARELMGVRATLSAIRADATKADQNRAPGYSLVATRLVNAIPDVAALARDHEREAREKAEAVADAWKVLAKARGERMREVYMVDRDEDTAPLRALGIDPDAAESEAK